MALVPSTDVPVLFKALLKFRHSFQELYLTKAKTTANAALNCLLLKNLSLLSDAMVISVFQALTKAGVLAHVSM